MRFYETVARGCEANFRVGAKAHVPRAAAERKSEYPAARTFGPFAEVALAAMAQMIGRLSALKVAKLRDTGYYADGGKSLSRVAPLPKRGRSWQTSASATTALHGPSNLLP